MAGSPGDEATLLDMERQWNNALKTHDGSWTETNLATDVTDVSSGRDEVGQEFDLRLAFTDTYIKRDRRWQVWATQHTRVKP